MRVLVLKTSSLGDIIHGLRVMTTIREQVPDVHVTWVARDIFAPIVRISSAVDETIVFERSRLVSGFLGVVRRLRGRRFDIAMDMQGRFLTGAMGFLSRAPRRVGRADWREGAGIFYNEKVSLPPNGRKSHALEILLEFCRIFGLPAELRGTPTFRAETPQADLPAGCRPIVVFPDSRRAEKCWPGFGELTEQLLCEDPARIVVWAGDRPAEFRQAGHFPGRFVDRTGRLPLQSLPPFIQHASWVLSNDSGPLHLAAALGIPTLGVFGVTDPAQHGPYPPGPKMLSIRARDGNLRLLKPAEVVSVLRTADPSTFGSG